MQIPKYRNFDFLPGSLKDYIWVIFSPDRFLDLIYRLCPEGAIGRWAAGRSRGGLAFQSEVTACTEG